MIFAKDALFLDSAKFPDSEMLPFRYIMKVVDNHIRKSMTFGGPEPLEIPFREMNLTTCRLLCLVMRKFKWHVNANLMSSQPRVQGAEPEPHHWVINITPFPEIYDELDFIRQISKLNTDEPLDASAPL